MHSDAEAVTVLKGAEEAYLVAAGTCWLSDNPPEPIAFKRIPGGTAHLFEHGDYKVLDAWVTNEHSEKTAGSTLIWHRETPVWRMQYDGYYPARMIPFLKMALRETCVIERVFWGGRGPAAFHDENYLYANSYDEERSSFAKFEGDEFIEDELTKRVVGRHRYHGGSMME